MKFITQNGWVNKMVAAAVVAVAAVAGSVYSSNQKGKAAGRASNAQQQAAQQGIDESRRQFDSVKELLSPYVNAGTGALNEQQNLIGLNGNDAQNKSISGIANGGQFNSMVQQGENSILQNASATGGLRGGNTQGTLAQFRPQLLSQLINQQYQNLGGIAQNGQNAASNLGNSGLQTGQNVSNLLQQQGAAKAGGYIAEGNTRAGYANAVTSGIGTYFGAGGSGGGKF